MLVGATQRLQIDLLGGARGAPPAAYREMQTAGQRRLSYLGLEPVVPGNVFAPTPMSELLGQSVLDEVREVDRVLDMGTGSGVNAILAASQARHVVGIDIIRHAVAAAADNAARNGVGSRTSFLVGDLFDPVHGKLGLISTTHHSAGPASRPPRGQHHRRRLQVPHSVHESGSRLPEPWWARAGVLWHIGRHAVLKIFRKYTDVTTKL